MDPTLQAIVAQLVVAAATLSLVWRFVSVARSNEVKCARCPEPGPDARPPRLPPKARRPAALRVLNGPAAGGSPSRGG